MTVLLMRFQAPMQSWGTQSQFRDRDTGREPSKSGVIGLLCAALGRPRWDSVQDLAGLKMGVRVDREGVMRVDYHTAQRPGARAAIISPRAYLSDAVFLTGLEGDTDLLRSLDTALAQPRWQMYLGRKAFVPSAPVRLLDGLREGQMLDVLTQYPLLVDGKRGLRRFVLEDPEATEVRLDVPLSFADRSFASRSTRTDWLEVSVECTSPV